MPLKLPLSQGKVADAMSCQKQYVFFKESKNFLK